MKKENSQMGKGFLVFLFLFMSTAIFGQWPPNGKIELGTMSSEILNEEREYSIYLPKSYETSTDKNYPVLYLLHGGGGSHKDWPERGHLADVANQLIASKEIAEMIIVSPEAGKTFMNYFNSPEWRYEDYFFEELIPYIEKNYRAKAGKKNRAIAGLSMGGGGTVVYASNHPEMFIAAYTMSGYFKRQDELFFIDFDDPVQKKVHQLVEDNNTIKLVESADPSQIEALKTVNWFIDCGDDDFTLEPNLAFILALKEAGIPYEFRVRDGGHTWEYWHSGLYIALPYISDQFRSSEE